MHALHSTKIEMKKRPPISTPIVEHAECKQRILQPYLYCLPFQHLRANVCRFRIFNLTVDLFWCNSGLTRFLTSLSLRKMHGCVCSCCNSKQHQQQPVNKQTKACYGGLVLLFIFNLNHNFSSSSSAFFFLILVVLLVLPFTYIFPIP